MPKLSARPEEPANPWLPGEDWAEWKESTHACTCGSLMWTAPWFDDPPKKGGARIGTKYECGDCGETDDY